MLTDESLALQVQQGQQAGLVTLVERHHSPLIGYLYRLTGANRALAEDLAQETFLRVIHAIRQYSYPRPFKPWLYAIATNLARDHYKRAETRQSVAVAEEELEYLDIEEFNPDAEMLAADESRELALALRSLAGPQREVIVLRYFEELPLAEIAEMLDIPVGTVKSRLSTGLRKLRLLLEESRNAG